MKTIKMLLALFTVSVISLNGGFLFAEPAPRPEPTGDPQVITIKKLPSAPTVDGSSSEWASIPAVKIPVKPAYSGDEKNRYGDGEVQIKAGYFNDKVYFMVQWKDSTKNNTHKNYVWDKAQQRYRQGKDREDRFIFKFHISGKYSTNPLAGWPSVSDIWHWKAYRSNEAGLAHDKSHIISDTKIAKSKKYTAVNGKTIYFARPSDEGTSIYKSERYAEKAEDVMPKYIINSDISGSIADVKAKGVWADGMWTLELERKLDTGDQGADVVFKTGSSVKGAISVFDAVGDWHESISDTLLFKFE